MMVMHLPVKFEFNWTKHFRVKVRKQKCGLTDEWTQKRTKNGQKNGQTNRQNYTVFELESGNENVDGQDGWIEKRTKNGQTDRKTDKRTYGIIPISKGT